MTTQEKKNMIHLYYEERYRMSEIARLYSISRQRVHQLITGYKSYTTNNISYKNKDFIKSSTCVKCSEKATIIHHLDRNSLNNTPTNLIPLCLVCHKKIHQGIKYKTFVRIMKYNCLYCKEDFERVRGAGNNYKFCSKSHAGLYRYKDKAE